MIRALKIIFSPEAEWLRTAEKNRSFLFVLFFSTIPLLAGAIALEVLGIKRFGSEGLDELGKEVVPDPILIKYAVTQFILQLAFLFGGGWFLLSVARSFNAPATFSQAFNTLAIGASPIFLVRPLDGIPVMSTWLVLGIGIGLAIRALYHGVAVVLKPEQTKGFGLYIVSIFIVGFLGSLVHVISYFVLKGRIFRDAFIS